MAKTDNYFLNLEILVRKQVSDNLIMQNNKLLTTDKLCKYIAKHIKFNFN